MFDSNRDRGLCLGWQRIRGAVRSMANAGLVAGSMLIGALAGAVWAFGLTASASAAEEIDSDVDLVAVTDSLSDELADISHLAMRAVQQDQLGLGEASGDYVTERLVSDLTHGVDELVDGATQQFASLAGENQTADDAGVNTAQKHSVTDDRATRAGGDEPSSQDDSVTAQGASVDAVASSNGSTGNVSGNALLSDVMNPLGETVSPLVENVTEVTQSLSPLVHAQDSSLSSATQNSSTQPSALTHVAAPLRDIQGQLSSVDGKVGSLVQDRPVRHVLASIQLPAAGDETLQALAAEPASTLTAVPLASWAAEPLTTLAAELTSPLSVDTASATFYGGNGSGWDDFTGWHQAVAAAGPGAFADGVNVGSNPREDVIAGSWPTRGTWGTDDSSFAEWISESAAASAAESMNNTVTVRDVHETSPAGPAPVGKLGDLSIFPGGAPASSTGNSADSAPSAVCLSQSHHVTQVSCVRPATGSVGQPLDRTAELSIAPD
ncbi:hypothetical protein [Natronoglycomyces albus]|uniref:Uncharacterized protein n=1 Tax=Natronoglycomyces albus TaxID=2811108 RepID=A0A895XJ97_9ACTN|nr:hypothetical protein [Natronoglycomyces albus]QSB05057.1 hypothetical protein JQS30_15060 [Natronoglycomyces albus]